jgi:hypothetical protein
MEFGETKGMSDRKLGPLPGSQTSYGGSESDKKDIKNSKSNDSFRNAPDTKKNLSGGRKMEKLLASYIPNFEKFRKAVENERTAEEDGGLGQKRMAEKPRLFMKSSGGFSNGSRGSKEELKGKSSNKGSGSLRLK